MEYRNDLADVLLNGLPDDEREQVIAAISQVDAAKPRRKRAVGADEDVVDVTDLDSDDADGDDPPGKVLVPEQG
jgi:hypothetical protein